jgi:hypothetical protein
VAAGAQRWGRAREAGRGRGVAWFGDPRGSFYRVQGGHWRGGRREEGAPSMVAREWGRAFRTIISEARTTSGRGCDEADALGRLAHAEEGGAVAAAVASQEGGGGLAFGRRKEKRERASAGPKGRSGLLEPLRLEGEVGWTGPKMGQTRLGW